MDSSTCRKLAALQWVLTFLLVGPVCLTSLLLLFRSNWWWVSLAYAAWYYWDRETCRLGGRRCNWVRNWRLWHLMAEYFPARLHKTCELKADQNYILGFHPHGVLSVGAFVSFATEATGFSKLFPGIKSYLTVLEGHFDFPIYREYLMCSGAISVKKSSMKSALRQRNSGQLVCVLPGGAKEALDAHPGSRYCVHLRRKRGFVRVAMETGSHLVPCISFGEIDLYNQVSNPQGSLLRSLQDFLIGICGFSMPLFSGHFLLPFARPINTIVGSPIRVEKNPDPTDQEVDDLLGRYVSDLQLLFDANKAKFDRADAELLIL